VSVRLFLLERWLPRAVQRRMFSALVRMTARAFETAVPDTGGLSMDEAVAAYARFTRREAERARQAGEVEAGRVRDRLYMGARRMGTAARGAAGVASREDAVRALRLLYAAIGIDLHADPSGEVTVTRCAFSSVYTPEACAFISALDAGLADGIAGGAALAFTERITEGAPCCRARLAWGPSR